MIQSFEQVKAASQDVVAHSVEMFSTVVDSATKVSELAVQATKEGAGEVVAAVRSVDGWQAETTWTKPADAMAPVASKVAKYGKAGLKLAGDTAETLSAQSNAAVKALSKRTEAIIEEATAAYPAQAEPMVKNVKAALAQGVAFYEQAAGVMAQFQSQAFAASEQFFAQIDKTVTEAVSDEVVATPKRKRA